MFNVRPQMPEIVLFCIIMYQNLSLVFYREFEMGLVSNEYAYPIASLITDLYLNGVNQKYVFHFQNI